MNEVDTGFHSAVLDILCVMWFHNTEEDIIILISQWEKIHRD